MLSRRAKLASLATFALALAAAAPRPDTPVNEADGIIQVRSRYSMDETIRRLQDDIAGKGITFFSAIDQAKLGGGAGVPVHPSTLLVFGNPALGVQFLTANLLAGLDWPVRLLVYQDPTGAVWTAYTDFAWIAERHQITDRVAAFTKASEVIASITASVSVR